MTKAQIAEIKYRWPGQKNLQGQITLVRLTGKVLLPALFKALQGRQIVIVESATLLPPLRPFLRIVEKALLSRVNIYRIEDLLPPNKSEFIGVWSIWYPDMFSRVEAEHDRLREMREVGKAFSSRAAAQAYRHEACLQTDRIRRSLVLLMQAFEGFGAKPANTELLGFDLEVATLYSAYFGRPFPLSLEDLDYPSKTVNSFLLIVVALVSLDWVLFRVRWFGKTKSPHIFDIGSDIVNGDQRHLKLMQKVCSKKEKLLLVFRNSAELKAAQEWNNFGEISITEAGDGHLSFPQGFNAIYSIVSTLFKRWSFLLNQPTKLLLEVSKFELRYWRFVTWLNRYKFDAFFGKDDYSSAHILRSGVLRGAGIQCIGGQHGLFGSEGLSPLFRYLDFDHYFMLSGHFYET